MVGRVAAISCLPVGARDAVMQRAQFELALGRTCLEEGDGLSMFSARPFIRVEPAGCVARPQGTDHALHWYRFGRR